MESVVLAEEQDVSVGPPDRLLEVADRLAFVSIELATLGIVEPLDRFGVPGDIFPREQVTRLARESTGVIRDGKKKCSLEGTTGFPMVADDLFD